MSTVTFLITMVARFAIVASVIALTIGPTAFTASQTGITGF